MKDEQRKIHHFDPPVHWLEFRDKFDPGAGDVIRVRYNTGAVKQPHEIEASYVVGDVNLNFGFCACCSLETEADLVVLEYKEVVNES
jgi:hypothetical protein